MQLLAVDYLAPDADKQFVESLRQTGFGVLKNHPIEQSSVTSISSIAMRSFIMRSIIKATTVSSQLKYLKQPRVLKRKILKSTFIIILGVSARQI